MVETKSISAYLTVRKTFEKISCLGEIHIWYLLLQLSTEFCTCCESLYSIAYKISVSSPDGSTVQPPANNSSSDPMGDHSDHPQDQNKAETALEPPSLSLTSVDLLDSKTDKE